MDHTAVDYHGPVDVHIYNVPSVHLYIHIHKFTYRCDVKIYIANMSNMELRLKSLIPLLKPMKSNILLHQD